MRGKLAITAIVITLALFALIWVLYGIIKENNDQYSKIVLSQRQQEFSSRILGFKSGQVVFDGTPEELTGEELTRIYGRNILEEKEGAEHEA